MIKFNCLIHKGTGGIVKYEEWLELVRDDLSINVKFNNRLIKPNNTMKAKEMLFSDDFEIIYDSEFTTEEIMLIYKMTENLQRKCELNMVLNEKIKLEKDLKYKYRIEV